MHNVVYHCSDEIFKVFPEKMLSGRKHILLLKQDLSFNVDGAFPDGQASYSIYTNVAPISSEMRERMFLTTLYSEKSGSLNGW